MPTVAATVCSHRLTALQSLLSTQDCPNWLISRPSDIFYYTGFGFLLAEEREAFLMVTPERVMLWYASFSPLPTSVPCAAQPMNGILDVLAWIKLQELTNVAIDGSDLSVQEHRLLFADATKLFSIDLDRKVIWEQRSIKDELEQQCIIAASTITTATFTNIKNQIKTGMTEIEVANLLDQTLRAAGATPAFPTIVAFGSNSALPHHQPTDQILEAETTILLDFGAKLQSYCSDFTRTWWHGNLPSEQFQTVATAVQKAYTAGITLLSELDLKTKPLTASNIDQAVRTSISQSGFGEKFIHTTGHGLGLEIHEPPSVSSRNYQPLLPGMTITIEPGVYLTGEFGYRFENTVLVTANGLLITTEQKT